MLGCNLSFEAYAKNVRDQATKCSLKTPDRSWEDLQIVFHLSCFLYLTLINTEC